MFSPRESGYGPTKDNSVIDYEFGMWKIVLILPIWETQKKMYMPDQMHREIEQDFLKVLLSKLRGETFLHSHS